MTTAPIVLVEDNPSDIELTLRAFAQSKIPNPLVVAEDAQAALDDLLGDAEHPLPALILLDLNLPRIDGLEVLRRLRAQPRTRLVPVVVLTTSVERKDVAAAYALGANSYIRKPVSYAEFAAAVAQIGAYWLELNEAPPNGR